MANASKRLKTNVEGNFFVDSTCIDCDTCRQLAPATFVEDGDYSAVFHQPETAKHELAAYQALIACPVGSIGTLKKNPKIFSKAQATFPLQIEDGVYYVGFNSEKSFGANSYFIKPSRGKLADRFSPLPQTPSPDHSKSGVVFDTSSLVTRMTWPMLPDMPRHLAQHGSFTVLIPQPCQMRSGLSTEKIRYRLNRNSSSFRFPAIPQAAWPCYYKNRFLFSGDHLWWDRDLRTAWDPGKLGVG